MERRLTTIFAADMVAYSRLVANNEETTISRLKSLRQSVFDPQISKNAGRIVKEMGDGLLIEFSSPVSAVKCAISVQRELGFIEEDDIEPFKFRIGVNLGDVLVDGEDILGDAVNIASRLEALAPPGGICVSKTIFDQLSGKIDEPMTRLGPQMVKNIPKPIDVWRVELEGQESPKLEDPTFAYPDKPSIAVLPLSNMSTDPDLGFICDGLSEDITTSLSKFHGLFVISRNTAFSFKGQNFDIRSVTRALGVQYVMDGSARAVGENIRLTVQLIDGIHDHLVWAEKFDFLKSEIFDVQDEIVGKIVGATAPEIEADAIARVIQKEELDLTSWEKLARGRWFFGKFTQEGNAEAEHIYKNVISENPNLAEAYALKGFVHGFDALYSWNRPQADSMKLGLESAQLALEIDNRNALALTVMGAITYTAKQHQKAIDVLETAVGINPNLSLAVGFLGLVRGYMHEFELADEGLDQAIRLSPRDPMCAMFIANKGQARFNAGNYEDAIRYFEEAIRNNPRMPSPYRGLTAALGIVGEVEKAREQFINLEQMVPGVTLSDTKVAVSFFFEDDQRRFLQGLKIAGMPD